MYGNCGCGYSLGFLEIRNCLTNFYAVYTVAFILIMSKVVAVLNNELLRNIWKKYVYSVNVDYLTGISSVIL